MISVLRIFAVTLITLAASILSPSVHAQVSAAEIGVVVMHGKGGSPDKHVYALAQVLRDAGYQVANLDMPWSARRQYDVDMNAAVNEITAALDAMRAKGAKKVFVAGHSQGGLFALHYGGQQAVNGLIAIAPGGSVDAPSFSSALGEDVARARSMVSEGHGADKARFADYESSRGTSPVTTTAASYLSWFDPSGPHTMAIAARNVKPGTPVLYVAPTRDYPALAKTKQASFAALPAHPLTRLYEPEASHLEAPTAASKEIVRWIGEVAAQP